MDVHPFLWAVFGAIMIGFMVVDLGWLNRKAHAVSARSAALQSLFWVAISLGYAGLIAKFLGHAPAADFLAAYLTEKMLSVDNLFVILLIFSYFKVKEEYRHRVLYWGILGALVFRGVFIAAGAAVIAHFHWILYFFGAFLVWSGVKLFMKGGEDDEVDVGKNKVLALATKWLPIKLGDYGSRFTIVVNEPWRYATKRYFTMLFVVLLIVETTDIMFAFDSIPAVFAITQDPFIVFASNIFAVMGLRALFFLVEAIMKRLRYLQQGLSFVLVFIGGKMLADIFGIHVSSVTSLSVVAGTLVLAAVASMLNPVKEKV